MAFPGVAWVRLPFFEQPDTDGDTDASDTDSAIDTGDSDGVPEKVGFLYPEYDAEEELPATYEADLDDITEEVIQKQSLGENLPVIEIINGTLEVGDQTVQLVEQNSNPCPDSLEGCTEIDSAVLGVGENALVASREFLTGQVVSQGSRGTCAAFAISAAVQILTARNGNAVDIGEQTTYLRAKTVEAELYPSTWEQSGLYTDLVIEGFAENPISLVPEDAWPYNPDDHFCDDYLDTYPGETCTETEVQGSGDLGSEPDPDVLTAEGVEIYEAHGLYASIGRVKQALYRGYPVVLSINANSDFNVSTYKSGVVSWVFQVDSCTSVCGHAILAVGYQDDPDVDGGGYVIVENSWGDDWGDDGLAYVTYEWLENSMMDANAIVTVE